MIIFNGNHAAFVAYKKFCWSTQSSRPTKKWKRISKSNAKDSKNKWKPHSILNTDIMLNDLSLMILSGTCSSDTLCITFTLCGDYFAYLCCSKIFKLWLQHVWVRGKADKWKNLRVNKYEVYTLCIAYVCVKQHMQCGIRGGFPHITLGIWEFQKPSSSIPP